MKKLFAFAVLFLVCFSSLYAQKNKNISWTFSCQNLDDGNVKLIFNAIVDEGFKLYSPYNPEGASKPLEINLLSSKDFKTDGKIIEAQKPQEHYEEIFDVTEKFFTKNAKFFITIKPTVEQAFTVSGSISGQICSTDYMCSSFDEDFSITINPKIIKKKATDTITKTNNQQFNVDTSFVQIVDNQENNDEKNLENSSLSKVEPQNNVVETTSDQSLFYIFLMAALGGLMAIFTPCVFPMLPMTVSFFIKNKKKSAKFNALIYGIFIILIYTIPITLLIIFSTLMGGQAFTAGIFNALSTHWLPNILFFLVFMIFAMSFLGMFEITLPSSIVNKMDKKSSKDNFVGIFFMAFVLVLVSFSCTGPIVGTVLVESASGGTAARPIVAMLGFSIAFALPFTFFAFFPHLLKKLPGYGGWLNTLKVVLGFVELALGMKFLSVADQTYHWHILDREPYIAIWIAISVVLGLYLLGKIKLPNDETIDFVKVPRLILAIFAFAFAAYLLPGLFGAPLKALAGYIPPITTQDFVISQTSTVEKNNKNVCETPLYSDFLKLPHSLNGYFDFNQGLNCAKQQNKPMLLVFTGHGCVNCRKMEENVWSNPDVLNLMNEKFVITALYTDDRYVPQGFDVSIGKKNTNFQIEKYNINAQPYYVILNPHNIDNPIVSPIAYTPDVDVFANYLKTALDKFYN